MDIAIQFKLISRVALEHSQDDQRFAVLQAVAEIGAQCGCEAEADAANATLAALRVADEHQLRLFTMLNTKS